MAINRSVHRLLFQFLTVVAVVAILPPVFAAETPRYIQPVKRYPGSGYDPDATAQVRIAQLRQTADQLRLLARQPQPLNASTDMQQDYRRTSAWLLEAEYRLSYLADQWEQRMKPQDGVTAKNENHGRRVRVNELFMAQIGTVQAQLRQESLALNLTSPSARAARETARVILENMQ